MFDRLAVAGPLNRDPHQDATEALQLRLDWLARAWPGTSHLDRLAPALDDLTHEQRAALAAEIGENSE
jgi:hypothetical protein